MKGGREIPKAEPTLAVAPPALLNQWKKEIGRLCSDDIQLIDHYGSGQYGSLKGVLKNKDAIFDENVSRAKTIVLTTPRTLAQRHGPKALHAWRMENGMSRYDADLRMYAPEDPRGKLDQDLSGCFKYVLVDEATSVKNKKGMSLHAVKQVAPEFTVLATGTRDANRVKDVLGLAAVIGPVQTR